MQRVALAALLSAAAFWGSAGLDPFYDDWVFPSQAAEAVATGQVARYLGTPIGYHWSPLWNLLALWNFQLAGWHDDRLIRGVIVTAQLAGLLWLMHLAGRMRLSPPAVAFAAAILALHHVRAAAVYSFDTYSQVLADLATWSAGGLACLAVCTGAGLRDRRLVVATAIPLLALLVKEQAIAGALVVLSLIAIAWTRTADPLARRRGAALAAALIIGVGAFAWARHAAGVTFADTGAYRICPGCGPRNAALIGGALVLPVRTLTVVDAWRDGQVVPLLLIALAAGSVVAFVAAALRTANGRTVAALLLVSILPVSMLGHVGELYAHTAVFWFALLMAMAADWWGARMSGVRRRVALVVAAAVYVLGLGVGLRSNLGEMRATGALAALWRGRYDAAVADLPAGSVLLVRGAWPLKNPGDYSLYRLTSPDFITLMWVWVGQTPADRRIEVVFEWSDEAREIDRRARREPVYTLTRTGGGFAVAALAASPPSSPPSR